MSEPRAYSPAENDRNLVQGPTTVPAWSPEHEVDHGVMVPVPRIVRFDLGGDEITPVTYADTACRFCMTCYVFDHDGPGGDGRCACDSTWTEQGWTLAPGAEEILKAGCPTC